MAKKILKRSLALGALMAFVITGSAMAAELSSYNDASAAHMGDFELVSDVVISNEAGKAVYYPNIVIGSYNGATATNIIGTNGKNLTILSDANNADTWGVIANTIIKTDGKVSLIQTGSGPVLGYNSHDRIEADVIELKSDSEHSTIYCGESSSQTLKAREIYIESSNDGAIHGCSGSLDIQASDILSIKSDKYAVRASVGTTIDIKPIGSKTTIKIDGNIEYLSNGIVNLELATPDSEFNGKIIPYQDTYIYDNGAANLRLSDGASWNVEGNSTAKNVNITSNGGNINLGSDAKTVAINTLRGDTLKVTTDNIQSKVEIVSNTNQNLTVAAGENITASLTDANQTNTLQGLADVVEVGTGNKEKTVTIAAGDVNGDITAVTDDNGKIATVKEEANTANAAVSDMASISMMTWRQENNDMNKRLGELRDSKGQHGAWARMARGESKYGAQSVKNQYNYYQIGYDEKLSTDPHWTVGVALTRTEGNSTFKDGSGENNHTGVAVYGSYLGENGSFIDLIAKYSRMDNEYKTSAGVGDADYKTNGYSVSAEYGKRFTKDNGLWIEPQVELTYGTVGSANYMTSKDASVRQDGIDSLVGRVGFALGKNIKAGNVYARASYLYDFDGETNVTYSKSGVTRSFEQDLGGGWWEVGIGSNINLSNATHLYFDVEKTYGGDVATPWQWNVGVRYSF